MNPSDEMVLRAFNQAPHLIQESLSEGSAVDFMESMLSRYKLHIDTVGYVMEFIRNMLLGLLQPDQFIHKLNSVGISEELARSITADLNKEVFIPLRDEMKRGGEAVATHPSNIPAVTVPSVVAKTPPTPVPVSTPEPPPLIPAVQPPVFNLIKEAPKSPLRPSTPAVPILSEETILKPPPPVQPPIVSKTGAPVPMMRTMQHDVDLIQRGVEATPYPAPMDMSNLPHPSQMTPAQSFQTASVPFTAMPIPVPAITVPKPATPIIEPRPVTPMPAPAIPISQPTPPVQKSVSSADSSSDPYRETI